MSRGEDALSSAGCSATAQPFTSHRTLPQRYWQAQKSKRPPRFSHTVAGPVACSYMVSGRSSRFASGLNLNCPAKLCLVVIPDQVAAGLSASEQELLNIGVGSLA